MGNRDHRGKRDDVVVKRRKASVAVDDGPSGGGGGGGPAVDQCGSRSLELSGVDHTVASSVAIGARLGWDTQDGRVLVLASGGALGYLARDDSARLLQCIGMHHRFGMIWEGNGVVLLRKEA